MTSAPAASVYRIADGVLMREVDGEAVLLDLDSQRYFGLDPVGTRIWQLLAEHGDRDRVMSDLLDEFAVEREHLEDDLDRFLERLMAANLVEPATAALA
ncbi:MAG: PqqD family protein [Acidobacteriota bacterium]